MFNYLSSRRQRHGCNQEQKPVPTLILRYEIGVIPVLYQSLPNIRNFLIICYKSNFRRKKFFLKVFDVFRYGKKDYLLIFVDGFFCSLKQIVEGEKGVLSCRNNNNQTSGFWVVFCYYLF